MMEPTSQVNHVIKPLAEKIKQSIPKQGDDIVEWYLKNVIHLKENPFPKICELKTIQSSLQKHLPSPKMLNQLFLEQQAIIKIIKESTNLVDIAFVLREYHSRRKMQKRVEYPPLIQDNINEKIDILLVSDDPQIDDLFRVKLIKAFIHNKKSKPKESCDLISAFYKFQLGQEIGLIFTYLLQPIFKLISTLQTVKEHCYRMVYWPLLIDDWKSPES